MPDPTGRISHLPDMHRGMAWKEPVRCATTGSITIASDLNAGDAIDGITLATGDRVLVKDQGTASQNGIYVAGATPVRAYDMDQDATTTVPASEVRGAHVYVVQGTANAGTRWYVSNTNVPVIGTNDITWAQWTGGAAFATPSISLGTAAAAGAASTVIRSDSTIVAFDATVPVTLDYDDVAATGAANVAARRDHVHGMPAAGGGVDELAELIDVNLDYLDDGDFLTYNEASGLWITTGAPSGTVPDGTDAGDILAWDGSAWDVLPIGTDDDVLTADSGETLGLRWAAAPGGGATYYRDTTTRTVTATTNETTVFPNQSITGGTLGSTGAIRVTLIANVHHGVVGVLTLRVKWGTTVIATVACSAGGQTADKPSRIQALIQNLGAENSQEYEMDALGADGTSGGGTSQPSWTRVGIGTAAADTSTTANFSITAQWDSNSGDLTYSQYAALVELLV